MLRQWKNAESVDIRNNAELPCELILNYTLSFLDILVVTTCDDYEPRILVGRYEDPPWWHYTHFDSLCVCSMSSGLCETAISFV